MKHTNITSKHVNYFFIIFLLILVFNIYIFLDLNEPFNNKKKRSRKNRCSNPKTCNSDQQTLYKCLTKNDKKKKNDFHVARICSEPGKNNYKSKTYANSKTKEVKCKINDKCDDEYLFSYTCIDKDDKDKIKTSNDNGWSENIDKKYHTPCNDNDNDNYLCNVM